MTNQIIQTNVTLTPTTVEVAISDARPNVLTELSHLSASQQNQLAHEAWRIGYRAVTSAHRLAEESRLQDVGKELLAQIGEKLHAHSEQQAERVQRSLQTYFDPESGQLGERFRQFVGEGGALPELLARHVGPQNSSLVETLVKHVGEQSPLFKKLSPTDSERLLQLMSERLRLALESQHGEFLKALDPLSEGGAMHRFILQLKSDLKTVEGDQSTQLKLALAALDTTKEDSLLNQLRRDAKAANDQLREAINPSIAGSPLAIIQTALSERLEGYAKTQHEQVEELKKVANEHQREVREAVQRIELRRKEELSSVRGGLAFEDAVLEFVQHAVGKNGYLVENTGGVVGNRPSCKIGDAVIHFPSEHGFHGAKIVVEAKCDKSYSPSAALLEIEQARQNRGACAGVFVMAKSRAGAGFPTFGRYGQDVLLVWDDQNMTTDPYLEGALMVALALAVRHRAVASEGDLQALQKIEQRVVKEVERLVKIREAAGKIRKQVDEIEEQADKGAKGLHTILKDAQKTLTALKVELHDDEHERAAPIELWLPANDAAEALPGKLA